MRPELEFFLILIVLSAASVATACVLAYGLSPERQRSQLLRPLLLWSGKGLLVPAIIWVLMNIGLSWNLQPFMPQIQAARASTDPWVPVFLHVMAVGLFIISPPQRILG